MLHSWLVALVLSFAPPAAAADSPACEIWVFEGDPWPQPTAECPSWTIYQPLDDYSEDVFLSPEPSRRRGCWLELIRMRHSFIDAMMHQAAGMLANPVARSPYE
jgi:hypothetical protein